MEARRSTAVQRRAEAVAAGMRVFADFGLTNAAVQRIADEIGVSQPYVFRLFGSKHTFFLACLDVMEARVLDVFRAAASTLPADPLRAVGSGFRELVADGVVSGLWLQACAAARGDEAVAARCRGLVAGVLGEAERLTGAAPGELAAFAANGALVMLLQALGVDLSAGLQPAVDSLRATQARR